MVANRCQQSPAYLLCFGRQPQPLRIVQPHPAAAGQSSRDTISFTQIFDGILLLLKGQSFCSFCYAKAILCGCIQAFNAAALDRIEILDLTGLGARNKNRPGTVLAGKS